jgi:acyl-CoA reductase-like NAD-dependent aldehyde dehydrogenase
MTDLASIDPGTAEVVEIVAPEHSTEDVVRACEAAAAAARPLDELGRRNSEAQLWAIARIAHGLPSDELGSCAPGVKPLQMRTICRVV